MTKENKFIELRRVCVPLGVACNLKCKYCYRENGVQKPKIPPFNDLMIEFLQNLDHRKTFAVIANGGETLLYMDRVRELFRYANPKIHRKLVTNGTYLTQEIVDYINENKVEVQLSYDGPQSKFLRGVDILEDDTLLPLIKQIKTLRVNSVITKYNTNCLAIYNHIVDKLKRCDFRFTPNLVYACGGSEPLADGLDLVEYIQTRAEVYKLTPSSWAYNRAGVDHPSLGVNVLPNGDVVDMMYLTKYGTVLDNMDYIKQQVYLKSANARFCKNHKGCEIRSNCNYQATLATPFNCNAWKEIYACFNQKRNRTE